MITIIELERDIQEIEKGKAERGELPSYPNIEGRKWTDKDNRAFMEYSKRDVKLKKELKKKGLYEFQLEEKKIRLDQTKEICKIIEEFCNEEINCRENDGRPCDFCGERLIAHEKILSKINGSPYKKKENKR